jgi:FkbM family methyltransferase
MDMLIVVVLIVCSICCTHGVVGSSAGSASQQQQAGLMSLTHMPWLEWPSLKTHHPQSMNKNTMFDAMHALNGIKDDYLKENLHRVDRYVMNAYGEEFLFAWTRTVCHEVNNSVWRETNGHEFAALLAAQIHQYRHSHIFHEVNHQVAIDIGAHVGDSTIPIAFLAKKTIAFEPSSHSFSFLKANVALNPHLNISAHRLAVGPTDGEAVVKYVNGDNSVDVECNAAIESYQSTATTASPAAGNDNTSSYSKVNVRVPMVALEKFIQREYGNSTLQSIGFIKIDAAGFDSTVLDSIHGLLTSIGYFPVIQVDYLGSNNNAVLSSIAALPGNYKPYCIAKCPDIVDTTAFSKCPFNLREIEMDISTDSNSKKVAVTGAKLKSSTEAICNDILLYPGDFARLPNVI